jgi:hypothetical protein
MQVGMEAVRKISKCLRGHYRAGDPTSIWDSGLKKPFQRLPCASGERCQELSIMEEEAPEDFGN